MILPYFRALLSSIHTGKFSDHAQNPFFFIHLALDRDSAYKRLNQRIDHFFEPSLLDDQFVQLEPLKPTERGITLQAELSPNELIHKVLQIQ